MQHLSDFAQLSKPVAWNATANMQMQNIWNTEHAACNGLLLNQSSKPTNPVSYTL